ncbi:MAG: lipocalin family protein [Bacteroidales bacterium]|nr:lipocalin family protein [Bacteroidales bacterium]
MKNIYKILMLLCVAFLSVSCGSKKGADGPQVSSSIIAEWHLVSVSGISSSAVPQVYISFASNGTFEMYQKVGSVMRYRKYDGTYTVSGNVVAGKYSDGEDWGSEYAVTFENELMVMTAQNGSAEVCKYEKDALSPSDKANAEVVTKSEEDSRRFL